MLNLVSERHCFLVVSGKKSEIAAGSFHLCCSLSSTQFNNGLDCGPRRSNNWPKGGTVK